MLKERKNISGGKKHRRAGECQGAKKNEEKDTKKTEAAIPSAESAETVECH